MNLGRPAAMLAVLAMLLTSCAGGPSRTEVLDDLAEEAIIPAYQRFHTAAAQMEDTIGGFCVTLDAAGMTASRTAVDAARQAWVSTQAMWVGPVMHRRSWSLVRWPVDPEEIEDMIADRSIGLDYERLATRIGSDQRGLDGLEYVLHAGDDPLAAMQDPRRCQYLQTISEIIADQADLLHSDWTTSWEGGAPYREEFGVADGDGLDSLVNDAFFLLESVTDLELGSALGVMGRSPTLEDIQEGEAGGGVADLRERLLGLQAVLIGGDLESGLDVLLTEDLAGRLSSQMTAALEAVENIEPPLRRAVIETPDVVSAARDAVKAVQISVATEVIAQLGVALGFSDADGDSSG